MNYSSNIVVIIGNVFLILLHKLIKLFDLSFLLDHKYELPSNDRKLQVYIK